MNVKVICKSGNLPSYETDGSAGLDVKAFIEGPITLSPGERRLISTGLFVELPIGYEAQIRGRSGLALKHGIALANGVGTIDSDYRGEIGVLLVNLGKEDFIVNTGDRIAQMIIAKYERIVWIEDVLTPTKRGSGGFGHTGL